MEEDFVREWTDQLYTISRLKEEESLTELGLDLKMFDRLQRTFMVATGLNGNIVNTDGVSLTADIQESAPAFCRLVQTTAEGKRRCVKSDHRVTSLSILQEQTVVCRCHAGLYDSAAPIRFRNHGVGAFITGQVLLEAPTERKLDEIVGRVADLGLDCEALREAAKQIPQITEEKLKATTEFLQILADYIVKSLEEAEARKREAEWLSALRETEMKVIQSKLHPHFLFNILNLISGQALLENASNTYTTVNYLSKMLRYIVKSYRPLVTLQEELDNLDAYVKLQCLRFEDRLTFHVSIADPSLMNRMLPCLTLQLLIENAIKHGIEPKEGPCAVHLRVNEKDGRMVVDIQDNGAGMSAERLRQLNGKEGDFASQLSGIGMIYKRLEYFYAKNFDFQILSEEGEGTTVTLAIPLLDNQ